jgi:hypothetical protein
MTAPLPRRRASDRLHGAPRRSTALFRGLSRTFWCALDWSCPTPVALLLLVLLFILTIPLHLTRP